MTLFIPPLAGGFDSGRGPKAVRISISSISQQLFLEGEPNGLPHRPLDLLIVSSDGFGCQGKLRVLILATSVTARIYRRGVTTNIPLHYFY